MGNKKLRGNNSWRVWDRLTAYSDMLYKRATGELEEMESAKSLCRLIKPIYKKGMKILDVGCGAGHYLRSLRGRVDKNINYTGVDATKRLIYLAKKVFGKTAEFQVRDVFDLKFARGRYDIVMCNNVILHLPPPPERAFKELIGAARKYVIIRTLFGVRNYLIKEVRTPAEGVNRKTGGKAGLIDAKGEPRYFNYFNLYTEDYVKQAVKKINKNLRVKIVADNNWAKFDNSKLAGKAATKTIGGKQIAGNILLDWRFIIIKK